MHARAFIGSSGGSTWARGGELGAGVLRRAYPASGAQWNVQVVKGKVNGKCLWNACKALSIGLLLMVLGATMATIGYYAEDLSMAQEVRGNYTVRVKNESRGFHLNNLSYAGPIVMGVGGFIVVAACVMTFEARDSAAKVVPARFKMSTMGPSSGNPQSTSSAPGNTTTNCLLCHHHGSNISGHHHHHHHHSIRNSSSQTGGANAGTAPTTGVVCSNGVGGVIPISASGKVAKLGDGEIQQRRSMTQTFMLFSKGLQIGGVRDDDDIGRTGALNKDFLKVSRVSLSKSPSAPDLALKRSNSSFERQSTHHTCGTKHKTKEKSRKTIAACALLNPQLLHRYALSVDETAPSCRFSRESLHGSEGSMAMDLHLDYPVTLRVCDRRKNPPLQRQRKIESDAEGPSNAAATLVTATVQTAGIVSEMDNTSRRSSHSCSPRMTGPLNCTTTLPTSTLFSTTPTTTVFCPHHSQSHHHQRSQSVSRRRDSNASDCTHRRSRGKGIGGGSRRDRENYVYGPCGRGAGAKLERAISSDSRLMGTSLGATGVSGGGVINGSGGNRCCGVHHGGVGQFKGGQLQEYGGYGQYMQQCIHSSTHRHPPIRNASAHCSTDKESHVLVQKGCSSDSDIRQPKHPCMHQYL